MPLTARPSTPPTHVAIIMDGNGRWAKVRGLPRSAGHKKGADALQRTLRLCEEMAVPYLTLYAFSSENWKRPEEEVGELMRLLQHYLHQELEPLHQSGVRLRFIGDLSMLSAEIREQLAYAKQLTERNNKLHLTVALSYGSRHELVRAGKRIAEQVANGTLKPENINEDYLSSLLDAGDIPDPDLLIRTGGEIRLSNFLLWQSAYAELHFTQTLWPDFDRADFIAALEDFGQRERRYGTTGA